MSARLLTLDDFVKKLQIEGPFRLTWLIGAGMSASAGVPLAVDVTRRIILFDHLCHTSLEDDDWSTPWGSKCGQLRYDAFDDFLDWYEAPGDQCALHRLTNEAVDALCHKDGFQGITPENPQCYPLLFANNFLSDKSHHVLTSLVRRAKGVNIAHLALAGILRDQPDWGHTVFTTNFDDLLLRAFLSLNHTARVFGEIQSTDRPVLAPTYPQIVHLHGRHTGYRLANTEEQFKTLDPNLRKGFLEHLRGSYLVVLGYSGWDDMAMNALSEWQSDDTLVNGVFWVPYKDESNLLSPTKQFLDSCPAYKANIIVSHNKDLDADSFMLAMCRAVARKSGFAPFRRGVLQYAQAQHRFTLEQLRRFPLDDPLSAVSDGEQAIRAIQSGDIESVRPLLVSALRKIGDDAPRPALASVHLLVGTAHLLLNNLKDAERHLLASLELWAPEPSGGPQNDGRSRTSLVLGQLYIRLARFKDAHDQFRFARRHADRNGNRRLRARALLGHTMTTYRYSAVGAAGYVEHSRDASPETDELLCAEIQLVRGDICFATGREDEARQAYHEAAKLFESAQSTQGLAHSRHRLGSVSRSEDKAERDTLLASAQDLYTQINDIAGKAACIHTKADHHFKEEQYSEALAAYEEARNLFETAGFEYSRCSVDVGLLDTKRRVAVLDGKDFVFAEQPLVEESLRLGNTYVQSVLEQLGLYTRKNKHDEEEATPGASPSVDLTLDDQGDSK